jgi:hypothetical protein
MTAVTVVAVQVPPLELVLELELEEPAGPYEQ